MRQRWRRRLEVEPLDEASGLELLRSYGIAAVKARPASSAAAAVVAAREIGYPVALKTAAEGIAHKARVGGVKLGLASDEELVAAYEELAGRLGPLVSVAEMALPGVEVAFGILRDAQFGPLLMVAAGGVLVEVLYDRALGLPPLDEARARCLVERLQLRKVLAAGCGPVAKALAALSTLALDLPSEVVAVDVNPVIVHPGGCTAVDVLVEREPARSSSPSELERANLA